MNMRKVITTVLMLLITLAEVTASLFSGYDFTFFKSVANSVATSSSDSIGLDYTGYGYLGDMTTGIFIRLGLQAPYSTLLYTLDDLIGSSEQESSTDSISEVPGQIQSAEAQLESRMREYKFLVALGPSFRRFVSPTLSWYMGLGIKAEIDRTTFITDTTLKSVDVSYLVSTDVDFGFRLTADIHTSLRIGLYLTRPIFTLNESYSVRNGEKGEPEYSFIQNLYPDLNVKDSSTTIIGYISLGHTYTDYLERTEYRYTITTREKGKGILEPMTDPEEQN